MNRFVKGLTLAAGAGAFFLILFLPQKVTRYRAAFPAGFLRRIFRLGFFGISTAGSFGSDIAFWVDDDLSVSGDNSAVL